MSTHRVFIDFSNTHRSTTDRFVSPADELDPAAILWEAQGPSGQPYASATGTQDAPVPILGLLGTILLLGVGLAVAYLTMRRSGPDPAGGGVSPR